MTAVHRLQNPVPIRNVNVVDDISALELAIDPATLAPTELVQDIVSSLRDSLSEFERRRRDMNDELKNIATELSVAIASKLVAQQIESDPQMIIPIVERCLSSLDRRLDWVVTLNPEDQAIVADWCEGLSDDTHVGIQFASDPTIPKGDFLLQSPEHQFISSIQIKLSEIRQLLLEELTNASIERRKTNDQNREFKRFPDRRSSL